MAGIIKAKDFTATGGKQGLAFQFEDMPDRANRLMADARREADRLVQVARNDAAAIRQTASETGMRAGLEAAAEAGRSEMRQRLDSLVPALNEAAGQWERERHDWRQHWERQLLRLAVAIAERVIRRELREVPDITTDLIRESIELASGQGHLNVFLHPDDLATLGDRAERVGDALAGPRGATLLEDPTLSRGGCRVETEYGVIDQRIETQLKRIQEELID